MARNTAMPSGYDYEFVKELHEDYICVICQLAMRNPVQTVKCGHQFCKVCLDEAYKRGRQCPVDREPLTPEEIFPNKFTERKILSLVIKCPDKGCDWQGELRNIASHDSRCDYKVVDCDNKSCKVRKPRCEMVRHVQEECQYRMVPCPHCKNTYTFCLLEKHTSNCPKGPVSCPHHCGKTMKREEVTSHLSDECPLTVVPCSYQSIGCTFKVKRIDLDDHIENHVKQHLNIAVEKIISLQGLMEEIKKQAAPLHGMEDLQKQMEEMKKQTTLTNQRIQKQMREIKKQTAPIKDLQEQMDEMKKQPANVMTKQDEGCLSYIWEIKNLNQPRGTDYSAQHDPQSVSSAPVYEATICEDNEEGWIDEEEVESAVEEAFRDLLYGVAVSSDPFYTHKNGYKLMLDLSNYVITLYVMSDEYDDTLTWPFYVNQVSFFHANHDQRAQQGNSVTSLYGDGTSCTAFQKPQDANVPIATCDLGSQNHFLRNVNTPMDAFRMRNQFYSEMNTPMAAFGGEQLHVDTLTLKLEIVLNSNGLSYRQLDSQLVSETDYHGNAVEFDMNTKPGLFD